MAGISYSYYAELERKKMKPLPKKEYKDFFFELTGPEGAEYFDLKINRWGEGNKFTGPTTIEKGDKRKNKTVHMICKVVGIFDERAPMRNWGMMKRFLEKTTKRK